MNKNKAAKLDAILLKFKDGISIQHYDANNNYFKDIDIYKEIEKYLIYLEADNMVEEMVGAHFRTYKLTAKGYLTVADIIKEGYKAKIKHKSKLKWILILIISSIISAIIGVLVNDCYNNMIKNNSKNTIQNNENNPKSEPIIPENI
jgi:hypothetical protein